MAASKKNPFPGMNPFLERNWQDVHTSLIAMIRESIATIGLPAGLRARAEERLVIDDDEGEDKPHHYLADVAVIESWKHGEAPQWNPDEDKLGGIKLAQPKLVRREKPPERWIEITNRDGRLVTAIEVLSPINKSGLGRHRYQLKKIDYLRGGANLVEIDLLRAGEPTLDAPLDPDAAPPSTDPSTKYVIVVHRGVQPEWQEVYQWGLQERIPAFRIPLRPQDQDIALDLQPLVNRCYELGYYWQEDVARPLYPPLTNEEAAWMQSQLRAAELIPS